MIWHFFVCLPSQSYIFSCSFFLSSNPSTFNLKFFIMKKTALFLSFFFAFVAFSASAQVKQVFKVMSYPDNKPLAGAVATLYGQSLQTNAKGVAVANLPENRKGDFLCMSEWTLDRYIQIGRTRESRYQFFQSNDTVFFYMVQEETYRETVTELFVKYFRRAYDSEAEMMLAYRDSVRLHPDWADEYAQTLLDYASHAYSPVIKQYYRDAVLTSPYKLSRLRDDVCAAAETFLKEGDVDGAAKAAKALIRKDDVSNDNLEIINDYMHFKDLNLVKDDGEPSSTYTRILYQNHFHDFSMTICSHLLNLLNDGNWEEADSITAKEEDRIPEYSFLFEPSFAKAANEKNPELMAAALQRYIDKCEEVCREYPYYEDGYWALYVNRRLMLATLQLVDDTVRLNQQWDSLLIACQRYVENENNGNFYKNRLLIEVYSDYLEFASRGLSAYSDAKILDLEAALCRAAKENYTRYPSDQFLQLQYAGWNHQYANSIENAEEDTPLRLELYRNQAEINEVLMKSFPEMFTVNYLVAHSSLLAHAVYAQEDDDVVRDAVRGFKRSFVLLDSLYPHIFTGTALDFCSNASDYLHGQNRNRAASELDAFIELLLDTHAKEHSRSIEAEKAQFFNHKAERMYYYKQYDGTLAYYEEANRYYMAALEKEPEYWPDFLTNYLQMGDAYLNMEMNEKALATYKKIFSYESQIPAAQMGVYIRLKGEAHYYSGDADRMLGNAKMAEKEYKAAENLYKRAMSLGDSTACFSLGEMYHTKAIAQYNAGSFKKVVPLMEKSAQYYQLYPMRRPYQRYEQVVSILENYYKDKNDNEQYVRTLDVAVEYYKRFSDRDTTHLNSYLSYSEKLASLNLEPQRKLKYARYEVDAHRKTIHWGKEESLPFLQSLYRLAQAYAAADSNLQALEVYNECLVVNRYLFSDTAATQCRANAITVYGDMINCANAIGNTTDEPENKEWYEKALRSSDTMIQLAEESLDETNDKHIYEMSQFYLKNALICNQLDWNSMAISQLDKANEYLLKLYEGKYKEAVESEIIRNLYLKGLLAAEENDPDLAKSYYSEAVEYATHVDDLADVAAIYYQTVDAWLDILENREYGKDVKTIESLKSQRNALVKIMKGKKK